MSEHPHDSHGSAVVNVQTKHETSDVNVKALLGFVAVFVAFAIVTHIVLYMMFVYYRGIFHGETNAPLTDVVPMAGADMPPEPRLQPFQVKDSKGADIPPGASSPVTDMANMRRAEELAQSTPAWIDPAKGRVRLPIELAKQLVVQRGLPVNVNVAPAPPAAPPATSTTSTAQGAKP
jgi:hypothetical protein